MATQETVSFEDLKLVSNDFDDEVKEIQLKPGEDIIGEIRDIEKGLGPHNSTRIHIARGIGDVVKLWSNRQIDGKMKRAGLGIGDVVGIKKTEQTATYVNEDGEEIEYNLFEVGSL